jgi:hypothetical protein
MKEYHFTLPDDLGCVIEFKQEGMPGIANIRTALREFEPKIVFAWHLSVMVQLVDLADNGMPSEPEQKVLDDFGDMMEGAILGEREHPNALFLARITWNATRELIYRVFEPEPIDAYLRHIIEAEINPRPFDYRIDHDPEWKLAEWHLNVSKKA